MFDGSSITIPRTDQTLALLLNTWYEASTYNSDWNTRLILNEDFTFQIFENNEIRREGTFEFYPQKGMFITYYENGSNNENKVYTIIEVTNKMLILNENRESEAKIYYKQIPVTIEKSQLDVPKEGGTFTINVQTELDISLKEFSDLSSTSEPTIYLGTTPQTNSISMSYLLENNAIKIKVDPATARIMSSKTIYVYDKKGYCLATLMVKQEGINQNIPATPSFSEYGISRIASVMQSTAQALNYARNIDLGYTQIIENTTLKAPVNSSNSELGNCWDYLYTAISQINLLLETSEKEIPNGPLYSPLQTLRAICYYKLAVNWGNVPFITTPNNDSNTPQSTTEQIFASLIPELKSAITNLEEKKNINYIIGNDISTTTRSNESDKLSQAILLSKDVAKMTLAKIYMYQNRNNDAQTLLTEIVNGKHYSMETEMNYTNSNNQELIFALEDSNIATRIKAASNTLTNIIPVFTYSDVILSLAECQPAEAMSYIQQITDKKGITVSESDTKAALKEVYKKVLYECGDYFAFLKRNGIAKEELQLTNNYYLILPIPQNELYQNPYIMQNLGY